MIYRDIGEVTKDSATVVTIGTFDGLHAGHREVIAEVLRQAKEKRCRSFVITFEPHPRSVLAAPAPVQLLTPFNEKLFLFRELGVENLLVLNFNREFSQQSSREFFLRYIINGTGVSEVILGHDHRFGKGRDGDFSTVEALGREFGFTARKTDAVSAGSIVVSSSRVRERLAAGDVETAAILLRRYYSISGTVVQGDQRGRTIGFPTANIAPDGEQKLIPANGVYAVRLETGGQRYNGVMNIGNRPTFNSGSALFIEVHLLGFNGNLYGAKVTVQLISRIRAEQKFSSVEHLINQIAADTETAVLRLSERNVPW